MALVSVLIMMGASVSGGPASTGLVAETRVPSGQHDRIVARTLGGMIAYTRWPGERPVLHLCVSGRTQYAGGFGHIGESAGRTVVARSLPPTADPSGCDVLYVGAMDAAARQQLMRAIRDRPVLSIAETDADCRGGTIFCLQVRPDRVGFRLSIDAVSRSAVRIDPRVLHVALPEGDAP